MKDVRSLERRGKMAHSCRLTDGVLLPPGTLAETLNIEPFRRQYA